MFKKIKDDLTTAKAMERLVEERLYEMIAEELDRQEKRIGLWTKALSKAQGDEKKANSLYIEYRLQSMKDEVTIFESARREVEKGVREMGPSGETKKSKSSEASHNRKPKREMGPSGEF